MELGHCFREGFKEVQRGFRELLGVEKDGLGGRAQEEALYMPQPEKTCQRKGCLRTGCFGALPSSGGASGARGWGVIAWLLALLPMPGQPHRSSEASSTLHLGAAYQRS